MPRKSKVAPYAEAILQQLREGLTMPEIVEGLDGLDVHPNTAREFFYTKERRPAYDAALKAGEEARGGVRPCVATREPDNVATRHGDEVFARLERGEMLAAIARDIDFEVSGFRAALRRDPNRKERYEEARAIGAEAMVAEGMRILDESKVTTSAEAMQMKARAEYRKWLAGKYDPEQFGKQDAEVNVTLSFGGEHLAALKELGSMDKAREAEEIREADYELLEDKGA